MTKRQFNDAAPIFARPLYWLQNFGPRSCYDAGSTARCLPGTTDRTRDIQVTACCLVSQACVGGPASTVRLGSAAIPSSAYADSLIRTNMAEQTQVLVQFITKLPEELQVPGTAVVRVCCLATALPPARTAD